jgi:hypothetical protein
MLKDRFQTHIYCNYNPDILILCLVPSVCTVTQFVIQLAHARVHTYTCMHTLAYTCTHGHILPMPGLLTTAQLIALQLAVHHPITANGLHGAALYWLLVLDPCVTPPEVD